MRCSYGATFTEPAEQIWASLADVDGYLAGRPGVTLVPDGDGVAGSLRCVLGSAQITYRLSAAVTVDPTERHTALIVVTGREARGSGTLGASLTATVRPAGTGSRLEISGDIQATGRGEAADEEAWSRVLGRLLDPPATVSALPVAEPAPTPTPTTVAPRPALAVAPDAADLAAAETRRWMPPPEALVGLGVVLLLVLRRRRKRRRAEGGLDVEQ